MDRDSLYTGDYGRDGSGGGRRKEGKSRLVLPAGLSGESSSIKETILIIVASNNYILHATLA